MKAKLGGRFWLLLAGGIAVLVVVASAATYLIFFRGSSVAPLTLTNPPASESPALTAAQVAGTWKVTTGSVAGYRVREQLAFLSAPSDAVGRTSSITGSVTITGTAQALVVSAANFDVNVSTLTSDSAMRDQHVQQQWLDSDMYPHATFTLSQPVSLPANAASGTQISVPATGELTIHGTTKLVTITLKAQLGGSQIEVQGSTTFPFEEFGMQTPDVGGFVSAQNAATLEFDLHFAK